MVSTEQIGWRLAFSILSVRVQTAERREVERLGDHFRRRNPSALETSTAVPRHKPPFWNLWVDQDNRIWVARHGRGVRRPETAAERESRERFDNPPSEWWDPLAFDVINPRGRFLGSIRFANIQAKPMVAEGQRVWVVEQGEYGGSLPDRQLHALDSAIRLGAADEQARQCVGAGDNSYRSSVTKAVAGLAADPWALGRLEILVHVDQGFELADSA